MAHKQSSGLSWRRATSLISYFICSEVLWTFMVSLAASKQYILALYVSWALCQRDRGIANLMYFILSMIPLILIIHMSITISPAESFKEGIRRRLEEQVRIIWRETFCSSIDRPGSSSYSQRRKGSGHENTGQFLLLGIGMIELIFWITKHIRLKRHWKVWRGDLDRRVGTVSMSEC